MPSQFGQDAFVIDLLGGLHGGYFLDSGAADGLIASNTHVLEAAYGWNGICVEPNDEYFAALVNNRRCHCVHCCLYDRDGTVEFLEQAGTLGGILDEYHPSLLELAMSAFYIASDSAGRPATVRKAARTVGSVLREYGAPPVIDYWSLDTEGSELAILENFPFSEYTVRVLTVEHNRLPVREQVRQLLASHDYRRVASFDIDDCYVHDSVPASSAWRSRVWRRSGIRS